MDGNDSAFPWTAGNWDHCAPEMREGVTKRELFAAIICAGLSACPDSSADIEVVTNGAVLHADALIKALNEKEGV